MDFSLNQLPNVALYVAPGYLARIVFLAKFPTSDKGQFHNFVLSVLFSVPLVLVSQLIAGYFNISVDASDPLFWGVLMSAALLSGLIYSTARSWEWVRSIFTWLGFHYQPEDSLLALTVLAQNNEVHIRLKDGKTITGKIEMANDHLRDPLKCVYITKPKRIQGKGQISFSEESLIIPLENISYIGLKKSL